MNASWEKKNIGVLVHSPQVEEPCPPNQVIALTPEGSMDKVAQPMFPER